MRIAYLGDLVGTPGRQALTQQIQVLRETHRADLIIANSENVANGSGITPEQYKKLRAAGVDGLTLGDHAFRKQQIRATLNDTDRMIRPLNLPPQAWGKGSMVIPGEGGRPDVYVAVLLGRLFMNTLQGSDPFVAIDRWLKTVPDDAVVLVELLRPMVALPTLLQPTTPHRPVRLATEPAVTASRTMTQMRLTPVL